MSGRKGMKIKLVEILFCSYYIKTTTTTLTLFRPALIFKRGEKKEKKNGKAPLKQKTRSSEICLRFYFVFRLYSNFETVKLQSKEKNKTVFSLPKKKRQSRSKSINIFYVLIFLMMTFPFRDKISDNNFPG